MQFSDAIWWHHNKSKMADGSHIENRFLLYLDAILADQHEIWKGERPHADIGHVTKTAIFANSRWQTVTILKIALSPYLSWELSDIRFWSNLVSWCTFQFPWWPFNKNSKFCKFKMADGRHIENCFLAISRRHIDLLMQNLDRKYRITCHYRPRDRDQNCNFGKFKMADGRHFKNSIISISQPRIIGFW